MSTETLYYKAGSEVRKYKMPIKLAENLRKNSKDWLTENEVTSEVALGRITAVNTKDGTEQVLLPQPDRSQHLEIQDVQQGRIKELEGELSEMKALMQKFIAQNQPAPVQPPNVEEKPEPVDTAKDEAKEALKSKDAEIAELKNRLLVADETIDLVQEKVNAKPNVSGQPEGEKDDAFLTPEELSANQEVPEDEAPKPAPKRRGRKKKAPQKVD